MLFFYSGITSIQYPPYTEYRMMKKLRITEPEIVCSRNMVKHQLLSFAEAKSALQFSRVMLTNLKGYKTAGETLVHSSALNLNLVAVNMQAPLGMLASEELYVSLCTLPSLLIMSSVQCFSAPCTKFILLITEIEILISA